MKNLRESLILCTIILCSIQIAAENSFIDGRNSLLHYYQVVPITFKRKDVSKIWGLDSEYEFWVVAFNRTFHTFVSPRSWRVNVTVDPKDEILPNASSHQYVEGFTSGDASSRVEGVLQINKDMQAEKFMGIITTGDDIYVLEPAHEFLSRYDPSFVLIYRRYDVIYPSYPYEKHIPIDMPIENGNSPDLDPLIGQIMHELRGKGCRVDIVADSFLIEFYNKDVNKMIMELKLLIRMVDSLYRITDFDGDDQSDEIGIEADLISVYGSNSSVFSRNRTGEEGAKRFAEECSYRNSNSCLSICFTYQNWSGIEGIAFYGPNGGICCESIADKNGKLITLNTASISLYNSITNDSMPFTLFHKVLITAHQIGHTFGAHHDRPRGGGECMADGDGHRYIMGATVGPRKPNSYKFSPCTIRMFQRTLAQKGASCLVYPKDCLERGNCAQEIDIKDPCCVTKYPYCIYRPGAECSYMNDPGCCMKNCLIAPNGTACSLKNNNTCLVPDVCDGIHTTCLLRKDKKDGIPCGINKLLTCKNGSCISNACVDRKTSRCECSEENDMCELCCYYQSKCVPASKLGLPQIFLFFGHDCNKGFGYCNENGQCINRGNIPTTTTKKDWIQSDWVHVLNITLILLLIIIMIATLFLRSTKQK